MRFHKSISLFVVFVLLAAVQVSARKEISSIISPEELKALVDSGADSFLVIDAREPEEYQEVHIPGAVNVPQKRFSQYEHLLPADKEKMLIFYCNGVKCGKSGKAAQAAAGLGYTNVLVYVQGMPVWEELNYPVVAGPDYEKKIETTKLSPADLQQLLESGRDDFIIVDVRDAGEFAEGHIPGAVNIPVAGLAAQSDRLDKEKMIVVYCNSGGRSYLAYRKLMKLSYKKIYQSLFADWKEAGHPVES